MAKKTKKAKEVNLYYMNGQAQKKGKNSKNSSNQKIKEREKRIQEQNKIRKEDFDDETEEVIQMTNKNKIKKDQEQRNKIQQQENKRKSRNKKIKLVLKIFLLLAIIGGAITFALVSPIFNIKEIQVVNNETLSQETIISLSELKTGDNIFKFISSKVAEKIKSNSYIEDVKIHRRIPSIIEIEVTERKHEYSVDFLGQYAYINHQGYILELSEDSKQKPIIQGITTKEEEVVVGQRLSTQDLERLEQVIKIMSVSKEYGLDTKITSIDISNPNNYTVYMQEEQKTIYLGDNSNLSNKILYVNAIIEQEKGISGKIYANGDLNNGFHVYFHFDV